MGRKALVLAHRWLGLAMALFLIPAALTGSVLVFKTDIDRWLNADLHRVATVRTQTLPDEELVDRLLRVHPELHIGWLDPPTGADGTVMVTVGNWPHARSPRDRYELFLHPATGELLGARCQSAPGLNRAEFIHWIRRFHYTLMFQRPGMVFMGALAVVWLVDSFAGLLLTFPRSLAQWRKWRLAWQVKPSRFTFDLHRASGLWLWPVLFVLALSSVYLNLTHEVFHPVLDALTRTLLPAELRVPVSETILEWQYPLHTGEAFGLTGRLVVFGAGLATTALAVTGVVMTVRKLRSHRVAHARPPAPLPRPAFAWKALSVALLGSVFAALAVVWAG